MIETSTPIRDAMRRKLTEAFSPVHLDIVDESEKHRGHGGWREGGETHFRVVMRSPALDGLSRVERSRAVHKVLAQELSDRVHALALDLSGTST
jgi:BolA family transcriptional regulator, general stress-responsive regulator